MRTLQIIMVLSQFEISQGYRVDNRLQIRTSHRADLKEWLPFNDSSVNGNKSVSTSGRESGGLADASEHFPVFDHLASFQLHSPRSVFY